MAESDHTRDQSSIPCEFRSDFKRLHHEVVRCVLVETKDGATKKIIVPYDGQQTPTEPISSTIVKAWNSYATPLFISEGSGADPDSTEHTKIAAIQSNSSYLRQIYNNVLCTRPFDAITTYGFSFGNQDNHIVEGLCKNRAATAFYIGIYPGERDADAIDSECNEIRQRLVSNGVPLAKITFFDSTSPGCWVNPPIAEAPLNGATP